MLWWPRLLLWGSLFKPGTFLTCPVLWGPLSSFPLTSPCLSSPPSLSFSFHFLPICSNYLPIAVNKISQNIFYFSPFCGWAIWEGMSSIVLSWGLHPVAVRCLLGPQSSEAPLGWKLIHMVGMDTGSQVDLVWGCHPEHVLGPPPHDCLRVTGPLTWQLSHVPPVNKHRKRMECTFSGLTLEVTQHHLALLDWSKRSHGLLRFKGRGCGLRGLYL